MPRIFAAPAILVALISIPAPARGDEPQPPLRVSEIQQFTIDPVADGALIAAGMGFSMVLDRIIGTGEIRPAVLPGSADRLLSIDKGAVTQTIGPHAETYSNIGLWTAYGYALLDPILSGVRDGRRALLVDSIMFAETISLAWASTDIIKIAVRRPRPIDYAICADSATGNCADNTDLQLSFYSGHAATTGAISATATYLAFSRSGPRSPRPWITLGVGTAVTAFVSYERVRSGQHFPTDVIVGSLAGATIGVLVPHFHRRPHYPAGEFNVAPIWIGYAPTPRGGGSVTAEWRF